MKKKKKKKKRKRKKRGKRKKTPNNIENRFFSSKQPVLSLVRTLARSLYSTAIRQPNNTAKGQRYEFCS
jgi:hypothetical protein